MANGSNAEFAPLRASRGIGHIGLSAAFILSAELVDLTSH